MYFATSLLLDARVGRLVTDDEQVAALAAFLVAVDGGVPGHEVHRQLVGLGDLAAAAALQEQLAEVLLDLDAGLELAHLQRSRRRRWRRRWRR